MKIIFFSTLFFILSSEYSFSQIRVTGVITDKKSRLQLEGVKVILKSSNVSGGGFFTGSLTNEKGRFDVTTSFRYPLDIVATKNGCKFLCCPSRKKKE